LTVRKIVSVIFLSIIGKTFILPMAFSQIPADHIPTDIEIFSALKTSAPKLQQAADQFSRGYYDSAKIELTQYFKSKAAGRYYFDWR